MSQHSSKAPPKSPRGVSRRRFVQSTTLLTGLSLSGRKLIDPSPAEATEPIADIRLAQAPPVPVPRAAAAASQAAPQIAAEPPIKVSEFLNLSRVLTGIDDLEQDLAEQYLQRCSAYDEVQPFLKEMTDTLSGLQGNRSEIESSFLAKLQANNGRLFKGAEQIVYLWYVGAFFRPNDKGGRFWDYGPPEHYFHGKAWATIGVLPPISGRGRVYWTEPRTEV